MVGWLAATLLATQRLVNNDVSGTRRWRGISYHSSGIIAPRWKPVIGRLPGHGVVIEPQTQVILSADVIRACIRMILPPLGLNHARVSIRAIRQGGAPIQMRLGFTGWRKLAWFNTQLFTEKCHANVVVNLNYFTAAHDPHSTANAVHVIPTLSMKEDGSTISDDAVKQRGEIKVGVTGNISQRVSLRGSVAWQKGSDDFAQMAGFLSMTVKW